MKDIIYYVSLILELLIATAGVVISILELKRNEQEKKRQKALRDVEDELVNKVGSNNDLAYAIKSLQSQIDEIEKNDFDTIREFDKKAEILLTQYKAFRGVLMELYVRLLKDESQFSLSYGFERYINAFRNFLSRKDLKTAEEQIKSLSDIDELMFSKDAITESRKSIFKRVNRLEAIWKENPSFSVEECINYHIKEMEKQYPSYSPENSVQEKAVYAYFCQYYTARKAIDQLISHYLELSPYIDELSLKYGDKSNKCS